MGVEMSTDLTDGGPLRIPLFEQTWELDKQEGEPLRRARARAVDKFEKTVRYLRDYYNRNVLRGGKKMVDQAIRQFGG